MGGGGQTRGHSQRRMEVLEAVEEVVVIQEEEVVEYMEVIMDTKV